MKTVVKILNKITEVFNIIAIVALGCLLLLVCANVVMRYIFKNPIPGTQDMIKLLMICLTPSIAVSIMSKQCIWVDVFSSKFNRTGQLIVDIITLPISVGILGVMSWQGFNMILKSYNKGTSAIRSVMSLQMVKEWPFRIIYFIAMAMAAIAALSFTIERFMMYKDGGMPHDLTETDRAIEQVGDLSNVHGEIMLEEGGDADE